MVYQESEVEMLVAQSCLTLLQRLLLHPLPGPSLWPPQVLNSGLDALHSNHTGCLRTILYVNYRENSTDEAGSSCH